jgi:ribose transport system ATP-binding protein
MLLLGAAIGLLNGACITAFRMPPFIVTLTGMMFFSGFAIWLTQSKSIYQLPAGFEGIGKNPWIMALVAGCVVVSAHGILRGTLFGRWVYAVGQNPRTARVSGVPVTRVLVLVYGLSGLLAAVAAVLITGRLETGSPVHWRSNLLDIVGATVIGGTSLYGGRGKVLWTVFGVMFLSLVDNSLNLLNLSHFTIMMVKGGIILLAAVLDAMRNRARGTAGPAGVETAVQPAAPPAATGPEVGPGLGVPAIACRGMSKSFFGVQVLRRVGFEVSRGRVLGLVGENGAGKSTLMNLLGGNLQPDAGAMEVNGREYVPRSPLDAEREGIAFIHQELNLFPNLTIGQNLYLTAFPTRWGGIDRRAVRDRARRYLAELGLELSPDTRVDQLTAGERQLVEIAKALASSARILILDEPTTSLTHRETEQLFALLERLRAAGAAIIYISHALNDVLRLCDDVVVLRDGEVVGNGPRAEFTADRLITLMVGRKLEQLYPVREGAPGLDPVLRVCGVTQPGFVRGVTFDLHAGEVLGVAGLMGSGRTELARILFGLDPMTEGEIEVHLAAVQNLTPRRRVTAGLAFLTEDRRAEGLCLDASIAENISLAALPAYARGPVGWLDAGRLRGDVAAMRQGVRLTATARDEQPVKTLSGGNQQKVVLAKWLMNRPRVLLLDEPTRGIDVGAKFEIYSLIRSLAAARAGILVISSEIEELIGICDRILVMRQGEIRDVIPCAEFDRERILRSALIEGHVPSPDRLESATTRGFREGGSG